MRRIQYRVRKQEQLCYLGAHIKNPEIRAEFRKITKCLSTPPKSTKRDRSGYLDRARDLGTESCIAVHSKSPEFSAAGRGGRGPEASAVAATQRTMSDINTRGGEDAMQSVPHSPHTNSRFTRSEVE